MDLLTARTRLTFAVALAAACVFITIADNNTAQAAEITIVEFIVQADPAQFDVVGTSDLPNGAKVNVEISFAGSRAAVGITPIKDGGFSVPIGPMQSKLLPGVYTVTARLTRREQGTGILRQLPKDLRDLSSAPKEFRLGTEEEETTERAKIRKKYLAMLENLHRVHNMLGQYGGFNKEAATWLKAESMAGQTQMPDDKIDAIIGDWEQFSEEYWETLYHTNRFDQKSFRQYILSSYFPAVDVEFDRLFAIMDRWYKAFGRVIYKTLDLDIPKHYEFDDPAPFLQIYEESLEVSRNIYGLLGETALDWRLIDMATAENPEDAHENLFRSKKAKFEIRKPGDEWQFDLYRSSPNLRIRIRPTEEQARKGVVVIGVEINDFPTAEDEKDLKRLKEIATLGRWEGFKSISKKTIYAPDDTMPGGKRQGLDQVYTSSMDDAQFQIREYSLFCRWAKRTYDVVCIVQKETFETYEEIFEEIAQTFKVLDDPRMTSVPDPTPEEIEGTSGKEEKEDSPKKE